jgi:hypothetical protein
MFKVLGGGIQGGWFLPKWHFKGTLIGLVWKHFWMITGIPGVQFTSNQTKSLDHSMEKA